MKKRSFINFISILFFLSCLVYGQVKLITPINRTNQIKLFIIKDFEKFKLNPSDSSNLTAFSFDNSKKFGKGKMWLTGMVYTPVIDSSNIAPLRIYSSNKAYVFFDNKLAYAPWGILPSTVKHSEERKIKSGFYKEGTKVKVKMNPNFEIGQNKNIIFYRFTKPETRVMIMTEAPRGIPAIVSIAKMPVLPELLRREKDTYERNLLSGVCMVLFCFFLIYIFIFLFNKNSIFNLWFALFCLSLDIIITGTSLLDISEGNLYYIVFFLIAVVEIALMLFLNHFIAGKVSKTAKIFSFISLAAAILIILDESLFKEFSNGEFSIIFLLISILASAFEVFRIIISGLRKKKKEARLVGLGILLSFGLFIGTTIYSLFFDFDASNENNTVVYYSLSAVIFPFFMGISLAVDFSRKSKILVEQLSTIQNLNEENLQKEKDKQEIILHQKENLEIQVRERTAEIVEQKEHIELKQKEILDSIHYAKRIQTALITSEKYIERNLFKLNKKV